MAELKMPRKGGAAALLQELNSDQKHISSNDGGNEDAKEEMITQSQPSTNNVLRRPLNKSVRPSSMHAIIKEGHTSTRTEAQKEGIQGNYKSVKERVFKPGSKEAITRLNLDMPEELHDAMKLYCARHKIKIRTLVCALVEDFLEQEA